MISCKILFSVDSEDLREQIWREYKIAHLPLREITGQDQECFTKEQFMDMLMDEDYVKFLVWADNDLIGVGAMSPNLEKAARQAYANPIKIRKSLPEYDKENIFYFNVMFVPAKHQMSVAFVALISEMVQYVYDREGVAVFDYSHNAYEWLPESIAFVCKILRDGAHRVTGKTVELVEIDRQVFVALKRIG